MPGTEREARGTGYRWVMLLLLSLPNFATNYAQFQLSAFAGEFMRTLNISTTQFSAVTLSFTLVAGVVGVTGGSLADRFGVRWVATAFGFITALTSLIRLSAASFWPFFLLSLLMGAFLGAVQASSGKIISAWFPERQTSFAFAVFCAAGAAGISLAQLTAPLYSGYRQALLVSGLVLLLAAVLWALLGRNAPKGAKLPPSQPVWKYLGRVARLKNLWIVAACLAMFTALVYSLSALLPTVLSSGRGMGGDTANRVASLLNITAILGSMALPPVQARLGRYRPLLAVLMLLTAAAAAPMWSAPEGLILPLVCLVGFFMSVGAAFFMAILTGLPELDPGCLGSATGLVTLAQYLVGGFLLPSLVIAPLTERSGGLLFLCAAALAAGLAAGALLLPETGKKG